MGFEIEKNVEMERTKRPFRSVHILGNKNKRCFTLQEREMKEQFRKTNYQKKNLDLLEKVNDILEEYQEQGIKVTLRQVYYQLVARDIIPNKDNEYKKISSLLTNARYSGDIDWNSIEDRTRTPNIPSVFDDIQNLLEVASQSYQLDRWQGQEFYIELWTEKDAISSVIYPITSEYQVAMIVNRGYSSASAMYNSRTRYIKKGEFLGSKKKVLLYLGDFDPSGLDMDRDIKERFNEFGVDIKVERIGLTQEQIKRYELPENPAKLSDVRAKDYVAKYGSSSWEVDALKPEVLQELIKNSILKYLDLEKFGLVREKEKEDLKELENMGIKLYEKGKTRENTNSKGNL